jgi:hypothetical protein
MLAVSIGPEIEADNLHVLFDRLFALWTRFTFRQALLHLLDKLIVG